MRDWKSLTNDHKNFRSYAAFLAAHVVYLMLMRKHLYTATCTWKVKHRESRGNPSSLSRSSRIVELSRQPGGGICKTSARPLSGSRLFIHTVPRMGWKVKDSMWRCRGKERESERESEREKRRGKKWWAGPWAMAQQFGFNATRDDSSKI